MVQIKVITNNVRGLADYQKRRNLFHYFHIKKYDVIMLQECHSKKKNEHIWSTQWGRKIWFSHGTTQARGVAILFSKRINVDIHNVIVDDSSRFIILYTTIESKKILFSNVYAPNTDDVEFFQKWLKEVSWFTPEFTILGGDFNLVLDLNCDKQGGRSHTHDSHTHDLTFYLII